MKNKKSVASNFKSAPASKNAVHNTSGAVMPDSQKRQQMHSEKDVQEAFGTDSKQTKKNR